MRMIEPIQIKLIHIAKSQLGLSDDEYQQAIGAQTHAKKWSSKDLTYFEADGLINYFKKLGFRIQSSYIKTSGAARRARFQPANDRRIARKAGAVNLVVLASRDQMDMIEALRGKITWRFEDGYQRWLTKYMRIPRIVTSEQAIRTIEGLKGLLKHQPREAQEAREA